MARLEVGQEVKATTAPLELISGDKVLVKVGAGCLWAAVFADGREIGAVIEGPSEYAVDAIVDTDEGAVGRSFKGEATGLKLYKGGTRLQEISRNSVHDEFQRLGYESSDAFIEAVKNTFERYEKILGTELPILTSSAGQGYLLWNDSEKRQNIIFVDGEKTGFIQGGKVFIVNERETVYVRDDTVLVKRQDGKMLFLDKGELKERARAYAQRVSRIIQDTLAKAVAKS